MVHVSTSVASKALTGLREIIRSGTRVYDIFDDSAAASLVLGGFVFSIASTSNDELIAGTTSYLWVKFWLS